jgi:acyl dehydratase
MILEPGAALPAYRIESVDPEAMKVWAVILRDPNPIHLDPAAVRAAGLGDRVINQGPMNVAFVMNMLAKAFPGSRLESFETRFVDNVYGGEAIEAGGTIAAVEASGPSRRITCDVWLKADERDVVISGRAVLDVPN